MCVSKVPLGDSVTEITCWRSKLWELLKANDLTDRIEFVGSERSSQQCDGEDKDFRRHQRHEGHAGYLAVDIANDHIDRWISAASPDVVMFMLGTNDIAQDKRVDAIVEAYTSMVETMRYYNENTTIIVRISLAKLS